MNCLTITSKGVTVARSKLSRIWISAICSTHLQYALEGQSCSGATMSSGETSGPQWHIRESSIKLTCSLEVTTASALTAVERVGRASACPPAGLFVLPKCCRCSKEGQGTASESQRNGGRGVSESSTKHSREERVGGCYSKKHRNLGGGDQVSLETMSPTAPGKGGTVATEIWRVAQCLKHLG